MSTSESMPCNLPQWAQCAAKELNRTFFITFGNSDPEFARCVKFSEIAAIIAKHAPKPNEQDSARLDWLEANKETFQCTSGDTDYTIFLPQYRSTGGSVRVYTSLRAAIDGVMVSGLG